DITADVGAQNLAVKNYEIEVRNGVINIDFSALARDGGVDFPMLSALEIVPIARLNSSPVAIASATPLSGAAPLEVDFTGSESTDDVGISTYTWTLDEEVISNEADFQYTFQEVGTYIVSLEVEDGEGLTDSTSVTIRANTPGVNNAPVAIASVTPETGNAPLDVVFSSAGSSDDVGIETYEWKVNDSIVSTVPDFPYTFQNAGNYTASLTITDIEGLSDTVELEIKVSSETGNNPPDAIATADVYSGIAPLAVSFTGSNSIDDVEIVEYEWTINDSIVSNDPDFDYVFQDAGNYRVALNVVDGEGLTDRATLMIVTSTPDGNTAPNAVATANVRQGIAPLEVTFTGSNSTDDQDVVSYEWQVDGETVSTQANFVYVFEQPGNYTVTLIVTDAQGLTDRANIAIVATSTDGNEPPKAVITTNVRKGDVPLEVIFTGSNSTDDEEIVRYQWFIDGNAVSEEADFTYTFNERGTFEVTLTVTDNEGLTDSETVIIESTQDGPFELIIYPNPATTQVTVRMDNAPAVAKAITIVDASGRIIHRYEPPQDQEETVYNVQLPILAAGMYVIVIDDMIGNEYIKRLIIKNY
ncbi:MAG: PKD domain-containing protein, partial [Leeuwenhoekiella sp.]